MLQWIPRINRASRDKPRQALLTTATLDEKSTSSGIAEPYARSKLKARTGGEKGTPPVTTACAEAGKLDVLKK